MESPALSDTADIECRVTSWFYRRMAMLAGMFLIFAALFFKDGIHSWPRENEMAAKKDWFEREVLHGYDNAKAGGQLSQWTAEAKSAGLPLTTEGEPVKWAAYAAERGWPEKPKARTPEEIGQQYWWGGAMALAAVVIGINVLISRRQRLVGHASYLVTPAGRKVAYADAFRVDKRKWALKGLATIFYREGGQGPEKKAVIDDLKFDGAGKVLDRLLAQFKGELIDKAPDSAPVPAIARPDLEA